MPPEGYCEDFIAKKKSFKNSNKISIKSIPVDFITILYNLGGKAWRTVETCCKNFSPC